MKKFTSLLTLLACLFLFGLPAKADITPKVITNADGEVYLVTKALMYEYYQAGWATNGSGGAIESGTYSEKKGSSNTNYLDPETEASGTKGQGVGITIKTQDTKTARFYFTNATKVAAFIGITGSNRTATIEVFKVSDNESVGSKTSQSYDSSGPYEMITVEGLDASEKYYAKVNSTEDLCLYAIKFWAKAEDLPAGVERLEVSADINSDVYPTSITLTCETEGAEIRYTLDGTDPTATTGTVYTAPFTVSEECTLKAIAFPTAAIEDSYVASYPISEKVNVAKCATPIITFAATTTESTFTITSATSGATIYYTTDGNDPTSASSVYTSPITVTKKTTVKAIAINAGNAADSEIVTKTVYLVPEFATTTAIKSSSKVTKEAAEAYSTLINENNIRIYTLYKGNNGGKSIDNLLGKKYENSLNIRANKAASKTAAPTEQSGSAVLVVDSKVAGTLNFVYMRQTKSGGDIRIYNTSTNKEITDISVKQKDMNKDNCYSSTSMEIDANVTYYVYAIGTTLNLFEISFNPNLDVATTTDGGNYATAFVDYNAQVPENATAYTATYNATNETVTLTEIEDGVIPANQGVVIYGDEATYTLKAVKDLATEATAESELVGETEAFAPATGSTYYGLATVDGETAFYQYTGTANLPANKAFLKVDAATGAPARVIIDNGSTSAIKDVIVNAEGNEAIYNIYGQRINDSYKGLVIKNGKKFYNK